MSFPKSLVTMAIVTGAIAAVACTATIDMGEVRGTDAGTPSFTAPPEVDASVDAKVELLACIGTECPGSWATCISEDGPAYKCGTDLMRDSKHCGACGNECPTFKPLHMTSRCVDGVCELECLSPQGDFDRYDWRNCNGLVDDGCEVDVMRDPQHCGACGNACAPGVSCVDGKCGCPEGLIECDGGCIDPMNDDANCGGCGNVCPPPLDACDPMPPNTRYGCRNGSCGVLRCAFGTADCNGDLGSGECGGDGCEVDDLASRENCGGCGIVCPDGLDCIDEGGGPTCGVPCEKLGKVFCSFRCVDLLNDPDNCGGCDARCNAPGPNQSRSCIQGICAYECAPGFGDCNGDRTDGCETDLRSHPAHCGACDNSCDLTAGQPCIDGTCLMVECDGGVAIQ